MQKIFWYSMPQKIQIKNFVGMANKIIICEQKIQMTNQIIKRIINCQINLNYFSLITVSKKKFQIEK